MLVELHPEARAELRSAALWYDQRRIGLGDEFIAEVATTLDRICEAADSFPKWPGSRAAVPPLRRFPYVIAFESNEREILVLAVAHAKRRRFTGSRAQAFERGGTITDGGETPVVWPRSFFAVGRSLHIIHGVDNMQG